MMDNEPKRIEIWEIREPSGQPHWIEIDRGSIDDQLYLIRRLRAWSEGPPTALFTQVRYQGFRQS